MNNWVKMTNDEMEVGIEIATLKKGELQIKYAKDIVAKNKEIERLNNIIEKFEEELEREINIKEEDLKIEHNKYIDINSTLRKVLERFKELKGRDK